MFFVSIPILSTNVITGSGPTRSISLAVTVFTELAKAFVSDSIPPYLSLEFFGHQSFMFPLVPAGIQYGVLGNVSQGDICI